MGLVASLDGSISLLEKVPASIAIVDVAVVCSGWHGVNALLKDRDCCPIIPSLGWVSRSGGDSLVEMEDRMEDENQIPVTIEEMPAEPGHGVGLEDERQDTHVGDGHNGAGQHNHQQHERHPIPADHVVHQPVDRLKGSVHGGVTAPEGVVEQGAEADLAIALALHQAMEQRWAVAPVTQEQTQAQAEAGRAQPQAPLALHGS